MGWGTRLFGLALFVRLAIPTTAWIDSVVAAQFLESGYQQAAAAVSATTAEIEQVEQAEEMAVKNKGWLDRFNPVDYVGERARRLWRSLGSGWTKLRTPRLRDFESQPFGASRTPKTGLRRPVYATTNICG